MIEEWTEIRKRRIKKDSRSRVDSKQERVEKESRGKKLGRYEEVQENEREREKQTESEDALTRKNQSEKGKDMED